MWCARRAARPIPAYEFIVVSGNGVVRSWTVIRQAFLPGFDVPFILVDVELAEQADLRVDRPASSTVSTPNLRLGAPVRVAFEDLTAEIAVPAFELVR